MESYTLNTNTRIETETIFISGWTECRICYSSTESSHTMEPLSHLNRENKVIWIFVKRGKNENYFLKKFKQFEGLHKQSFYGKQIKTEYLAEGKNAKY